jgi:superkiller protein 3
MPIIYRPTWLASSLHGLVVIAHTPLKSQPQADMEFAQRAFKQFASVSKRRTSLDSLIPPFFALDRCCQRLPKDPSALHLFSLVCERLGQLDLAHRLLLSCVAILESAYEESEDTEIERRFVIANVNLGRVRLARGDFLAALEAFGSALGLAANIDDVSDEAIQIARLHAQFGSGLASYKLGDLENALNMFETASQEVPEEMIDVKGHVTILLTQSLWALGSEEARGTAKGMLLEWYALQSLVRHLSNDLNMHDYLIVASLRIPTI